MMKVFTRPTSTSDFFFNINVDASGYWDFFALIINCQIAPEYKNVNFATLELPAMFGICNLKFLKFS
jgi:hypothetical protein